MGFLAGKKILIAGLLSNRSIAYGIAEAMKREGAELAFTYQMEKHQQRVADLAADFDSKIVLPCDVAFDEQIDALFPALAKHWDGLDGLVHSLAFVTKVALDGDYLDAVNREYSRIAHDISAYSLIALARGAAPLMVEGGSIVAMTYYGAEKVVPHHNVLGVAKAALEANTRYLAYDLGPKKIRVNCISAGPVNTLAGRGISGFHTILDHYEAHSPLKRNVLLEEIGAAAAFLASDGATAITGQVLYVDCGYSIMGM